MLSDSDQIVEPIEIDTLVSMLKMAYSFENWDKVISISVDLNRAANRIYKEHIQHTSFGRQISHEKMERSLVYYFGYSYLMKGLAFQKLKLYGKAKECVAYYSDLNWLDDSSEVSRKAISDFHFFARANMLALEVLTGNLDFLPGYVDFLLNNPKEVLPGLITIIETAISNGFNVDAEIDLLTSITLDFNIYENRVDSANYLFFKYLLALYQFKNENYSEAINYTLQIFTLSDKLGDDKCFKKAMVLFEAFRNHASVSQMEQYLAIQKTIFKGAIEDEEGIDLSTSFGRDSK
ncbi:hypothetical protein D3C73_464440 [compost metagenome]